MALRAAQRIQISTVPIQNVVNRDENVMIHHLSIAARDPQHVAEVLAEFMGGAATRFTPNPGSWFAHQHDEYGTGVEVYPAGTELRADCCMVFTVRDGRIHEQENYDCYHPVEVPAAMA